MSNGAKQSVWQGVFATVAGEWDFVHASHRTHPWYCVLETVGRHGVLCITSAETPNHLALAPSHRLC